MKFKDKVVVVTGGARGIGYATALLSAREGACSVVCDLDPDGVEAAVKAIRATGATALGVVGDVSDRSSVAENVAHVIAEFGRIDVLVNNAATQVPAPARELTEDHWRRELDVCLTGTFFWSQIAAVESMIPRRSGVIVNVGSGAGLAAAPNTASYVAAKHGIVGLTKALAVDWGQYDIRVNCVCPGFTWTELARSVSEARPEMMKERVSRIPLGSGAQPEDVANAVCFLASAESAAVSGSVLSVDGGTSALSSGYSAPRDGT
ncbi:SDR family NAD(P)-dependent oxidoreductase [Rhodococcus opacus]|uniref:SDR family NAD(P)-dependent oxidoreductase n=1 Tax=Rhodococcus opacus TaxID=37919 RepID=UPI001C475595|nr:SDR family NAD(P)-dependent oxidoreductase [Rhodococcus opacus]MBV6756665.1 SDR family oxidoreductase [Rhodococcus opacus]